MRVQGVLKALILLVTLVFLAGCDAVDTMLPSTSAYKLNARVNGISLDECSFVSIGEKIYPCFEEPVSNDPDVTALMVFLKNSKDEIAGGKVLYSLDDGHEQDETIIQVVSLDNELPSFSIPANLPPGRYTLVSQVMSGRDILQKIEKAFFYLGNNSFSFEGINIHLPGITDNHQLIPKGSVIMLETKTNFEGRLDPYIVWYNGKRKISEGRFSDGADCLFWKAPEQSGFFSIHAEIFPVDGYDGLAGYQKEISLLVSSKTIDVNLVSENIPQLVHWYVFEGNLNDSKMAASAEWTLKPFANNKPKWLPANGTYGLAAGHDQALTLPKILIQEQATENWQTLFRFKPLNDGVLFSLLFESSPGISMNLAKEGQNLVLTLSSPLKTVSQRLKLPDRYSFLTAGVSFSTAPDMLSARINIMGDYVEQGDLTAEPVYIEADIKNNFQILLGCKTEDPVSGETANRDKQLFTSLWDEFALYNTPPMEIITAEILKTVRYTNVEFDSDSL